MTEPLNSKAFFIVGVGASAGGLEALEELFKAMPADTGCAFVVVVHLDPTHVSLLPDLLQRRTAMPVTHITDNLLVEPNHIYVIPPNKSLAILNKYLQLMDLELPRASHLPIDYFFRSLAQDQGSQAICIVLSGTGSDGSQGLREIKAEAGLVIAQDESTAKYAGMPESAVATGLVDYLLSPAEMPAQIMLYTRHPHIEVPSLSKQSLAEPVLQKILTLIRNQINHDFSLYKKNTIYRRIERRMHLHQIEKIADYLAFLQKDEREVAELAKELLIGVTSFFRDAEAFELLQTKILPELLAQKPANYTLRVWVPGCSTGEEAYSIAIMLQECLDKLGQHLNVQIFGTDIDEEAIEKARRGFYPASIGTVVCDERLKRFFVKEDDGFKIKKSIREMLVFAIQNITKDPPFTKLDLLSCRNLLIYFSQELQLKILPLFHYALKESGILFLGSSETTGQSTEFFTILDRKWKIFSRLSAAVKLPNNVSIHDSLDYRYSHDLKNTSTVIQKAEDLSMLQLVEAILRRSAAPPCAIIDSNHNIVYVHGRLGRFLEPAEGKISVNIVDMVHPGLKAELISALRKAEQSKNTVLKKPCTFQGDSGLLTVAMSVSPIMERAPMPGLAMIVFDEILPSAAPVGQKPLSRKPASPGTKTIDELQQELISTKENLQTIIEELETANEELKSTNEELQSTNEELQNTNEELETSKEELQSLNEEAVTVNTEMQNRIDDYQTANDDLKNLFDSTQAATIFLDTKLCIRRFTPKAKQIINLVTTDVGRPIAHFSCTLQKINLTEASKQVLKTLDKLEMEIYDDQGSCFLMRILPYRTTNNVIDGVVLSFEDISVRKKTELALINSEKRYKNLFDYSPVAIWEEDCSRLAQSLQQLRGEGITDLGDYLAEHPEDCLKLMQSRQVLAANPAALNLFKVLDKNGLMEKQSQLLSRQATQVMLAIWNQQESFALEFEYTDLSGNRLPLSLIWTVPKELGLLNYANVITTVLAQNLSRPL
ncbi:MAG: chemotaxis protein CheB [Methylococcales bacterium]